MIRGSNGFSDYTDENLRDPQILALARKVKVEIDKEADAEFPAKRVAKIAIKLKDGTTYRERVDYAKGQPENPLTQAELEGKFRGLASVVADKDRMEKIIQTVNGLEKLGNVSALISLLS